MNLIVDYIRNLSYSQEMVTLFKLLLIVVLAEIIGYERESYKKPAGFRTYILVGISSVLGMICGDYIYLRTGADPTRIPAQLLSGIGFLGAGTILRDGYNVKGLTTAAALLAITCIGLAVGSGYYIGSIIATIIVYIVLSSSHFLSGRLEHFSNIEFTIATDSPKDIIPEIEKIFLKYKLEMLKLKIIDNKEDIDKINIIVRIKDKSVDMNKVMTAILSIHTVKSVVEAQEIE